MNIFDDIKADSERTECNHMWVWSKDEKSIYCYDCKLIKYIKPGVKLE